MPEEAQEVRELMEYEEGTAGALMTTEFIALPPDLTVSRGLSAIAETGGGGGNHLLSLYPGGEGEILLGVVSLRELLIAEPDAMLAGSDADPDYFRAAPKTRTGRGRRNVNKYDLLAIPVVDEAQNCWASLPWTTSWNAHPGPRQPGDLRQSLCQQARHEMR